jgi:hypothetical protein
MNFPVTRLPCQCCQVNYMNYICHPLLNGKMNPTHWIALCTDCIINNIVEIIGEHTVQLKIYSLPIIITQIWDEEENKLLPSGKVFPNE